MRRFPVLVVAILAVSLLPPPAQAAAPPLDRVVAFDPAQAEFPEGIAFGPRGDLYVSLAPLGQIRRLSPRGCWSTFATIPPGDAGLGVLGLAADRRGTVYAAAPTSDPAWHGVVTISKSGRMRRLEGTQGIAFPNALTLGRRGTLYVTDSITGAVWRIPRGGKAELWIQDDSLEGTGALGNPFPIGANGIVYHRERLYVVNLEQKRLLRIPVLRTGAAGRPSVVHEWTGATEFPDGVAVDAAGDLYIALAGTSEIVRFSSRGQLRTLASAADGLSQPASLAFGTRGRARRALYITNFSLPAFVEHPMPGVVRLRVGVPGPPLRRGPVS